MSFPKHKRFESKTYTDWVKAQPSCISGLPADDPHHIKGRGFGGTVRAPDWAVIPLTRAEHDEFHRVGWRTWEAEYGEQLEHVARTLGRAIEAGILEVVE